MEKEERKEGRKEGESCPSWDKELTEKEQNPYRTDVAAFLLLLLWPPSSTSSVQPTPSSLPAAAPPSLGSG